MPSMLCLYNTLTGKVEPFEPLRPPQVKLYVCGPTVYDAPHLGHGRSAIVFDTLVRFLRHSSYRVSFVRNITDVGHLMGGEGGEDKLIRKAKAAQRAPMEVATHYTRAYHTALRALNTLPPDLEPCATAHIPEQIALVQRLLAKEAAYEANGSVYFDVLAYHRSHGYGRLSGARVEEMMSGCRALQGQTDKRSPLDFALWKRAPRHHLMQWPSPWGAGYPGWHLECTAMSAKYLGTTFDIHGGGRDLAFPHHECEIAQGQVAYGACPARYWVHHNMVTLGGSKMSKSTGNQITLADCFAGTHPLLSRGCHPMAFRLLVLQAHYRSELSISDAGLQAATVGYHKLINAYHALQRLPHAVPDTAVPHGPTEGAVQKLCNACQEGMQQDLHTARTLSCLFGLAKYINSLAARKLPLEALTPSTWQRLKESYHLFLVEILGIVPMPPLDDKQLLETVLYAYKGAKKRGDEGMVNHLRKRLSTLGVGIQDTQQGVEWRYL